MPGGSWSLKLIKPGLRILVGSIWFEVWHVAHIHYLISQSASCQLAMSKCKLYYVSFKLKVNEMAEKKSNQMKPQ